MLGLILRSGKNGFARLSGYKRPIVLVRNNVIEMSERLKL